MASNIERPTLAEIQRRVFADFRAELPGNEPTIPLSTEFAFCVAIAGASHLKNGRIDYAMRQQFADTADTEGLDHHASVWGITRLQPQKSQGSVQATGTAGTAIPIASGLTSPNDDLLFVTTAAAVIGLGGQVIVPIEAVATGSAGNKNVFTKLEFSTPIPNVDADVTVQGVFDIITGVSSGLITGADLESDDLLLERLLFRIQGGKLIGKPGDWEAWALEYPGVTRAWEVPNISGPGTIGVFFVTDDDPVSVIPGAPLVALVDVDITAKAPTPATTIALAPTEVQIDQEISISPDTPEVRTAVELELEDMLIREASAKGFTLSLSKITEAISRAPGEDSNVLILPATDQVYALGELPTLGSITWS